MTGFMRHEMILDSATSSTAIGYMRLEVFADEFLDGLFQSSYLNNGILLVDANGKKITGKEQLKIEK